MTVRVAFKFAFQNIVLPCTAEAEYNTYPLFAPLSAGCLSELKLEEKEVYFPPLNLLIKLLGQAFLNARKLGPLISTPDIRGLG